MALKNNHTLLNFFLVFFGIFAVVMTTYLINEASYYKQLNIFHLIVPVVLGVTVENLRLSNNWKITAVKLLFSLVISLYFFIYSLKQGNFVFREEVKIWALGFIALLTLTAVIYHRENVVPRISEGTVLIQSISFLYWLANFTFENKTVIVLLILSITPFALLNLYHVFSQKKHSKQEKIILGVWSSVIMLLFSINTVQSLIKKDLHLKNLDQGIYTYFTFFIVGISLVYIFKNAEIVFSYFPQKGQKNYRSTLNKVNRIQLKRFVEIQVNTSDSITIIVFLSLSYFLNFNFDFIDPHVLIWLCFIVSPEIIKFKASLQHNRSKSQINARF